MATGHPLDAALARAHAQERRQARRREINRAMIEAARERDEYVARHSPACPTPTPEMQAHQRLRDLLRDHANPELAALRARALAWLAEDQPGVRGSGIGARGPLTPNAYPLAPRPRRHPLEYVPNCPWRVTVTQARLLDLRCLGASTREIAAIETISRGAVQTALKRLCGPLAAPTQPAARAAWRAWCAASGRTLDPSLVGALELVRGRPLSPAPCPLSPEQEVPHAG